MLVCASAFLGIGASAAAAAAADATAGQSYAYTGDIGSPDAGTILPKFNNVIGVTNDGKIFIIRQRDPETGEGAFDVLDASGASIVRQITGGSTLPATIAVSADGSAVFLRETFDDSGTAIQKWVRTSTAPLTYTQDTQWSAQGLQQAPTASAVDPVTGDLLLTTNKIYRFDATSGALLQTIDGSTTAAGGFTVPASVTVGANRDIYVVDDPGHVYHFGPDGSSKGSLAIPNPNAVANGVAVNPQNGDVAIEIPAGYGATDAVIRLYTSANVPKDVIRIPSSLSEENHGLAFAPDGSRLYVGLTHGSAHVYSRGTQPGLDAPLVTNLTATGAHLSANVATGGKPTTARIEYCLASDPCEVNLTSEDPSPWHRLPEHSGLATPEPGQDTIADDLSGLAPNTKYLLRTFAVNEGNGVENRSATTTLATAVPPPLVTTAAATDLSDTSAQLIGSVDNTFGDQTTFHFEYGLTTSYGSRVPAAEGVAGSLRTPRTFSRVVKGLQSGTTYHFRLVATNSGGSAAGADRTFTTLGVDEVAPGRGYEQVTPVDKKGLALMINWGFQASPDGSALEYGGTSPAADGLSAAVVSRYVSRRNSTGWVGAQPLDPPFHLSRAVINSVTLAVSEDFEHALVVSQVALAPGATEGAANLYIRDLGSGAYRFVGGSTDFGAFINMTGILQLDYFVAGAPDFSWVALIARNHLLPGAPQAAMYKWTSAGGLALISRLPDESIPTGLARNQSSNTITNRFVSDDGDTVIFSLRDGEDGVYRRSDGQTEAVSVSRASGGPTGVQPAVADGLSRDGNFVVFHSSSQLTDDDTDGVNSEYRYNAGSDEMEYLGPQDGTNDGMIDTPWIGGDAKAVYFNSNNQLVVWREGNPGVDVINSSPVRGSSFGSPNGRYFAFINPGGGVSLYDADAGDVSCLSCRGNGTVAQATLPNPDRSISNRLPQVVTDDGHAYFESQAPLLGADRNATSDVYEYFHGRLTLISPGNRDFAATFADISADGSDVFFQTAQGLVSQDTDQSFDVYDARIGGGLASQNPPPPAVPCAGDACQGEANSPPLIRVPGSASTKNRGGNSHATKNCKKGKKGKKCRKARKAKKHAARSTNSNAGGAK